LLLAGILVRWPRLRREPAVGNVSGRPRRRLIAENIAELRRGRPCGKADHEHKSGETEHETLRSWARLGRARRPVRPVNILNAAKPGIRRSGIGNQASGIKNPIPDA
jgi:hypothetical protein